MKIGISLVVLISNFVVHRQPVLAEKWPNEESLLLFLPLDVKNGLIDIANGVKPTQKYLKQLETSKRGPFGIANSSYTVSDDFAEIAAYELPSSFLSFTLSMYYHPSDRGLFGAIASFGTGTHKRFSILYNGTSLEVHRYEDFQNYSSESFSVANFFEGWTFVCLTYDHATSTANVMDQFGQVIHKQSNFKFNEQSHKYLLHLGFTSNQKNHISMKVGDSMACVMFYNQVLSRLEIARLAEVCRWKGKSPFPIFIKSEQNLNCSNYGQTLVTHPYLGSIAIMTAIMIYSY